MLLAQVHEYQLCSSLSYVTNALLQAIPRLLLNTDIQKSHRFALSTINEALYIYIYIYLPCLFTTRLFVALFNKACFVPVMMCNSFFLDLKTDI